MTRLSLFLLALLALVGTTVTAVAQDDATADSDDAEFSASESLAGDWEVDAELLRKRVTEMMQEQMQGQDVPPEMQQMMEAQIEMIVNALKNLSLSFDGEGGVIVTSPSMGEEDAETQHGTYEIEDEDGKVLRVRMTEHDENGEPNGEESIITLTFHSPDRVDVTSDEGEMGMAIPMVRADESDEDSEEGSDD